MTLTNYESLVPDLRKNLDRQRNELRQMGLAVEQPSL